VNGFSALEMLEALIPGPQSFGADPDFSPRSALYNPSLSGRESSFYNTYPASGELTASGVPFAFFPQDLTNLSPGFPVVFEVG
jgi:hypothetical protein